MNDLHYVCRVVPETGGSDEQQAEAFKAAKAEAVSQIKDCLERAGEDYKQGHHRVTMSMDSTFERASVIAEWWPHE